MMRIINSGILISVKIFFVFVLFTQACSDPVTNDRGRPEAVKKIKLSVEAFKLDSLNAWGYEILINGKTYIHQEFIPALEGEKRFNTREDALKVGQSVLKKIRKKQSPALSREEVSNILQIPD
jgi:hypothetical protein